MNVSHLAEHQEQTDLSLQIGELQRQMSALSELLGFLAGRSPNGQCRPFICEGKLRLMVTAEELSTFIPRSPGTLIEWATKGKIPARKLPPVKRKGKPQWMFDLPEVLRDLDGYRVA